MTSHLSPISFFVLSGHTRTSVYVGRISSFELYLLDQFKFLLGNIASQSHSLQGKKKSLRKENRSRDIFGDKVKKEVSRSSNCFFYLRYM